MTDEQTNVDPKEQSTEVVHRQLALMKDVAGQTLQTRFERFCEHAVEALTQVNEHGEPVLPAGKAKATCTITVEVARASDDAFLFEFSNGMKFKLPSVPGLTQSSPLVQNVGLAERVVSNTLPLFNPSDGQPKPLTREEAEEQV